MLPEVEPTPLPPPPIGLARPLVGGRYLLDGTLGEGGMGRVHRAYHRQLGKAFALKVIAPVFHGAEDIRARFIEEAQLASAMAHPNIVQVTDFGEDPAVGAYMVMEVIDGVPLLPAPPAPLPVPRALEYLRQIADAVEHIHHRGVVHGDLKPDNMLVVTERDGERRRATVKLLDFGLARRIARTPAPGEPTAGSPHYLAPECIRGGPPTIAADVYALGALMFELLTGAPPFDGPSLHAVLSAHLYTPIPTVAARRGEPVDPALETLVARALAKRPEDRHLDVAELRYELRTVMEMLGLRQRKTIDRGARGQLWLDALGASSVPQALVTPSGAVVSGNRAFAKMLRVEPAALDGLDLAASALAEVFPTLAIELERARHERYPIEQRAEIDADGRRLQIVLWLARSLDADDSPQVQLFVRLARR